jgi:Ig-like domain CHU_C associated/Chitobiase/beta-hexosaminidase C-terminal domain
MKSILLYLFTFVSFFRISTVSGQTNLNSNPGSAYVLYLDFDGHSDNSGWWSSTTFPNPIVTAASSFSSAQITEVFNRVAEDYRPFNINITTQQSVYDAAPVANRQRIVITANSEFYTNANGGAGGVAYIGTFGGGEIAGYVFTNFLAGSAKNAGEACSHEAGHTLGLQHHSQFNANCSYNQEYHPGKGTGQTKWAPIMGNSYSSIISQWYNGSTNGTTCAAEVQDDLSVITSSNGFSYRTDDFGSTLGTAGALSFVGTSITQKGIITTTSDVDAFKIVVTTPGFHTFFTYPTAYSSSTYSGANLDVKMWITNQNGTILNTANDTTRLDATLSSILLSAGTYYVFVEGTGVSSYKDIGGTGTVDYGSIGEYTLSVNRLCTPIMTSAIAGSRCGPGAVSLSATASNGTVNWYATNTSTTVLGTGSSFTTPSLSASSIYFAGSIAAGCSTASARIGVEAIINPQTIVSGGADKTYSQTAGNQTLSGTPIGGVWSGTGVTSAGVFNPNRTPGTYTLTYCVTNNTCTNCDTVLVTVTAPATQVPTPVISPGTGTYTSSQTVTLSCGNPDAVLYYTLTGNTPVIGAGFTNVYNGPFLVSQTTAVKVMGVVSGLTNSAVASALLTINNPNLVANPVITPGTGSFSGQQTISIACATSGASIFYTTNGNIPGTAVNSFTKLYTGTFTVNATTTIRALAVKAGLTTSGVSVAYITITSPTATVATPVIAPGTGTYAGPQSVSISCATAGASIYYTTSGNNPVVGTSFTKLYAGAFPVSVSTTVRAMGVLAGSINSGIAVSYITLSGGRPLPAAVSEGENLFPELVESDVRVYPNPGSERIFLDGLGDELQSVRLLNMKGQVQEIPSVKKDGSLYLMDVSEKKTGLYLIQVVTNSGVKNIRFVRN